MKYKDKRHLRMSKSEETQTQPGHGSPENAMNRQQHALQGWVRYSSLGLEMAVVVAACVLGGVQLDKRTPMHFPLWTIVGCFTGLAIGMARLLRASKQ